MIDLIMPAACPIYECAKCHIKVGAATRVGQDKWLCLICYHALEIIIETWLKEPAK